MITNKIIERRNYIKQTVVKYYLENKNVTLRELEIMFNCSRKVVTNILKEENIEIRNRYHDIKLKYNFKEILSEESAYWLGFIYADGSISYSPDSENKRYCLELGLKESDKNHIKKFKDFIGSKAKINFREKTKSYRIMIFSKEMLINIYNLGIVKNKTYNNNFEVLWNNVPIKYRKHFIRGFFDGDGSIANNFTISFTSNYPTGVLKMLNDIGYNKTYKIYNKQKTTAKSIKILKEESIKILHFMYDNSTIYLDRKYKKFKELPS